MPDASALLSHILAQTRSNVEFLISQNAISRPDGSAILAKLPSSPDGISDQMRRMTIPDHPSNNSSNAVVAPVRNAPPAVAHAHALPPGPPQPQTQRAKALWAYNEHGSEPNDLSFRAGDIVEVLAETNADWWTGRVNGREGLFPSNYVEKIESAPSGPPPAPAYGANAASSYSGPPPPSSYAQQSTYSPPGQAPYPPPAAQSSYAGQSSYPGQNSYGGPEKNAYGAPAPYQSPPPPQQQYPPPQGYQVQQQPPPQQQQVVVQQEQKPSLKSKYGGLLATSAVGGAGFGAGSAIGSGLVNAIF